MGERDKLIIKVRGIPLSALARQVLYGEYTPGIEDEVFLDRVDRLTERGGGRGGGS